MAKVQGHVSPTPSAVLNHQVLPLPAVPNPTSENLRPADVQVPCDFHGSIQHVFVVLTRVVCYSPTVPTRAACFS